MELQKTSDSTSYESEESEICSVTDTSMHTQLLTFDSVTCNYTPLIFFHRNVSVPTVSVY